MSSQPEQTNEWKMFGGWVRRFKHESVSLKCAMNFTVYVPPQAASRKVPVVYYLSGLTCTDENVTQKACAQRAASSLGLLLVCPDTSPRGHPEIEGENDAYDFGTGAGFYVDATEPKWAAHYKMYSYVNEELPALIASNFPADMRLQSIFGHSMGGHGALTIAMKDPERFASVSAFSPICAPTSPECAWGQKALAGYLGADQSSWTPYDACSLLRDRGPFKFPILVDQGTADQFYPAKQLQPESLEAAASSVNQKCTVRYQEGYDHSYFFIASFMDEHLQFHAKALEEKAATL
jgi:S-formylglutathione hydrolase